jgi:serine/threonine protein kinase
LQGFAEPEARLLFQCLLELDWDYRRRSGEAPEPGMYLGDFEQYAAIIEQVGSVHRTAPHPPDDEKTDAQSSSTPPDRPLGPPLSVGTMVDKYRIRDVLGRGAFGTVYLCEDTLLKRPVAVKVAHRSKGASRAEFASDLEEARKVARLEHRGVIPVFDGGFDEKTGSPYIVMKYVGGSTLEQRLRTDPPSADESAALLAEVAETLAFVHQQNIMHRDLKPSNILLDQHGHSYVTDFGMALDDDQRWDQAGMLAGSPAYMSPEQVQRETQSLDGRTDIWALGVILYELLTGRRPFRGATRRQLNEEILHGSPKPLRMIRPDVSERLQQICLKCLAKSVEDRYQSAADLAQALRGEVRPVGPNPYRGLAAFGEEDAEVFFGREEQTNRLWERFRELHESAKEASCGHRILPLLGPSGCGKSSLARAGLIAELHRRPIPGWSKFQVVSFPPGNRPLESLSLALARLAAHDPTPVAKAREFEEVLRKPNGAGEYDGLRRIADAIPAVAASHLVLLIDQFEKVYSLCKDSDERQMFIECLLGLLRMRRVTCR